MNILNGVNVSAQIPVGIRSVLNEPEAAHPLAGGRSASKDCPPPQKRRRHGGDGGDIINGSVGASVAGGGGQ